MFALWRLVFCVSCAAALAGGAVFDVRQYGAAGDGRTKDTRAIAKAIEACVKAGGGTVYFPPGKYLTGAINLKSNVTLHIEAGATMLGSPDVEDYPLVPSPWSGEGQQISALIYGDGVENITITGRGTIDGQGEVWWNRQRLANPKGKQKVVLTGKDLEEAQKVKHGRPHLVKLIRCKNLLMEGLTLKNSPSWTVNPVFSEGLTFRGLTILNPQPSPNTDGINPESCRNVHISNCHIDVGDDCVTIKSGKDEVGRRVGKPCENITVTNCTMINGHGGVVVGSEMSGGAKNISVSNCTFQGTLRGIRLKTQRGRGGVVDGMVVSNIVMENVPEPFSLTMYYSGRRGEDQAEPVTEGTPVLRNILLHNIVAHGARIAGEIRGLPEMPIAGVTFSNVRVWAKEGFLGSWVKDLAFHDVQIETDKGPALVCRNVDGLEIDGLRMAAPHGEVPVIDLNQVKDVFLRASWAARGTGTFVKIGGSATRNVVLSGNNVTSARQPLAVGSEVAKEAVVEK